MMFRNIVAGGMAITLMAGCALVERQQVDYKAGAVQVPPLEVPPDLTAPETEQRYALPDAEGGKVASYSEYTRRQPAAVQPCVAPEAAPAKAAAPAAGLLERDGVKYIQLGEPFDRSWRRVGLAIEQARVKVADKDRSRGVYFVSAGDKKQKLDYRVMVKDVGGNSEATVVNADGKSDGATAQLLETLYHNLDK